MRRTPTLTLAVCAAFALSAPATHVAASSPPRTPASAACGAAVGAAEKAEAEYRSMFNDYRRTVIGGGHPDTSQRAALDRAKSRADTTASHAVRACPDAAHPH